MVKVHRQVVIIGAGIAGLWTLRRLTAAGYDAILLEGEAIGAGQTLGAQGILHGGVKYGLDGSNRDIAARLRSLPPIWLECLAGTREPSLAAARTLSPCQHLWAADSWLAKVGATVGARAMQGEVRKLDKTEWPAALEKGGHKGSVYELAETVIDVKSVLTALAAPVRDRIFLGKITAFEPAVPSATGTHTNTTAADSAPPPSGLKSIQCGDVILTADVLLFMAATGNEEASRAAGFGPAATQRRPLKQVMVRGKLPPLYGHCVTVTPKPVVTITAHPMGDDMVWYLGGGVAEDAVALSDDDAIRNAMNKLRGIFPDMPWKDFAWACWQVDRSEPNAASRLPDGPALLEAGSTGLAWPTKLVYAPALADLALEFTARHTSLPAAAAAAAADSSSTSPPLPLPPAPMGNFPWETAHWRTLS